MTAQHIVRKVIDSLEEIGVPYMLVGSFSSNAYGIPRNTHDADFVVELGATSIQKLAEKLGPAFVLDPQISFESVTGTTRFIFNVSGEEFTIEVFQLSDDPHDRSRFARRQQRDVLGGKAFLPAGEDVVITKLRWARLGKRQKDLADVRDVISVSGPQLDWDYIHRWAEVHGTRKLLDELRASIPPI